MEEAIEKRRIQFGDEHKYIPFAQSNQNNNSNTENIILQQIAIINEILSLKSKLILTDNDTQNLEQGITILFDNLTKLQKL